MIKWIKRYQFFIIMLFILIGLFLFNVGLGKEATGIIGFSFKEMLLVIPPVFVLLGLLDVWVPREIMMRYMGEDSGIKGVVLAILIGSAAAGPLYGAFPVAAVFMKKGVKLSNVLIFIGAWSTTKIPMLLFELSSLGWQFTLTRLLVNIPGIIIMASILGRLVKEHEVKLLYANAENL